jgi:alkylhydroperoxidase/carboxymuconolactone decarboxylase family protein YurZ
MKRSFFLKGNNLSINIEAINPIGVLAKSSQNVADAFLAFRQTVNGLDALDARQRELCLVSAFTTLGDKKRMAVHGARAVDAGATQDEVRHAVLLMLGATTTLSAVSDSLEVLSEVFAVIPSQDARKIRDAK